MEVKLQNIAGLDFYVEITAPPGMGFARSDRCFRFNDAGDTEYALFGDLLDNGAERARWYSHQLKEKDFVLV